MKLGLGLNIVVLRSCSSRSTEWSSYEITTYLSYSIVEYYFQGNVPQLLVVALLEKSYIYHYYFKISTIKLLLVIWS